jgi:predicted RNA-binding Zn ribbon-like protein
MATSDTRWVWYGGRSSLDFVNTRRDRERAGVEYLTSRADLADWLEALGEAPGRIDDPLLAEALELREAIDTGVRAVIAGEPTPRAALRTINRWLKVLPERPPQLRGEGGLTLLDTGAERSGARQALARLALDAAQLLGTDERVRLRVCAGEDCAGRFLDQSPAGRRRWCSMAVCGNRHKVAAHRRTAHD